MIKIPTSLRNLIIAVFIFLPWSVFAQDEEILPDLNEQIVQVPIVVDGFFGKKEGQLTATIFRPSGNGPFPLIVLSHGNPPNAANRPKIGRYRLIPQIREFLKRDFAVIVPIRRGYGKTGGAFAEDYGSCSTPFYYEAGLEAAKDLLAAITYASTLPFVLPDKIILVGQSAGGFASIATASLNPPGVVGIINFSGGRGGRPATHPGILVLLTEWPKQSGNLPKQSGSLFSGTIRKMTGFSAPRLLGPGLRPSRKPALKGIW